MNRQRVALVTGASSGFGLLASIELARRGLRVFASMRDLSRADRLRDTASEARVKVETVQLDVTSADGIRQAVSEVQRQAAGVDVLVNNAGIGFGGFFEDTSEEEFRSVMETNFFGALALTRAVLPGMRARRFGRIINLSSVSGRLGGPGFTAYAASKFALEGMSEALRSEVVGFGIHVVLVEPGMFRTDIFGRNKRMAAKSTDPSSPYASASRRVLEQIDALVEKFAGDPQVVANIIADAATEEAPSLRYLAGPDARAMVWARSLLPQAVHEWVFRRALGLDDASQSP